MITDRKEDAIEIHDKTYECADVTTEPYLGYLQEMTEFYLVNDHEYESLKNIGEEVYVYNYRIKDVKNFEASVAALQGSADCAGLIKLILMIRKQAGFRLFIRCVFSCLWYSYLRVEVSFL